MEYIDSHAHILSAEMLPEKVLERWNVPESVILKIAKKIKEYDYIIDAMEYLWNIFCDDIDVQPILYHYLNTIDKNIYDLTARANTAGFSQVNLLLLDLEPNWGTNLQRSQEEVHREVFKAVKKYKNICKINVFMGVNLKNTAQTIIKNLQDYPFSGVKIYPKLKGNKPSMQHADLWKYLQENKKPIVTHCSGGGIGTVTDNSDPVYWFDILMNFTDLKICFAHHARGKSRWYKRIKLLWLEAGYNRVFVDTAFDSQAIENYGKYFNDLRAIINDMPGAVLFGSDWPLHTMSYNYGQFARAYQNGLSPHIYNEIAHYNPTMFLYS